MVSESNKQFLTQANKSIMEQKLFIAAIMLNLFVGCTTDNVSFVRLLLVFMGFIAIVSTVFVGIFKNDAGEAHELAIKVIKISREEMTKADKLVKEALQGLEKIKEGDNG